ncbi:MAG TPA: LysM peptidoglycan-binding domain-containing protein, partial [Proteobacteria bacterium]|nr:LysM peptidoglycan-binding domain-containing protein [Pseudomonadota bacterium]
NPELLGKYTSLDGPYALRIPKDRYEEVKAKFDSLAPEAIYLSDKKIDEIKRGRRRIVYRVRRGDSLYSIARKFGVTVSALKKWNPKTARKKYLHPGDRLVLYVPSKYAGRSYSSRSRGFYYTVKKGDSLYSIARKYRVTVSQLKSWNPKLKKSRYIYPGMKLLIKR